jgi:NDP-sugar pyrophosphorylase family protein
MVPMSKDGMLTVVVLAGGAGTRMGELSKERPKHLLEVDGIPLVMQPLEQLIRELPIARIVYRVAYRADLFVERWHSGAFNLGVPASVVVGQIWDGPIGALVSSLQFLRADTFLFVGGDMWYQVPSFASIVAFHRQHESGMTVGVAHSLPSQRPSTLQIGNDHQLQSYTRKEQTTPGDLINASFYLVNPEQVDWLITDYTEGHLPNTPPSEYKEDHLWRLVQNRPDRARFFELPGRVVNINSPQDLENARVIASH